MDDRDNELLNLVQNSLPLSETPYAEMGAQLGLSEDEVLTA